MRAAAQALPGRGPAITAAGPSAPPPNGPRGPGRGDGAAGTGRRWAPPLRRLRPGVLLGRSGDHRRPLPEAREGSVRLRTGLCFPYSPALASPSSAPPPQLRGPHPPPRSLKGRGARVVVASPSLLGKAGDSSAAGHRSLRGELQPLGMQCRETHAFLFSFPKNKVAPFAFPSLFLLKAASDVLPR